MPLQRLFLVVILLLLLPASYACTNQKDANKTEIKVSGRTITPISTLSFLGNNYQTKSSIDIAIAKTEQERNLGLMDVNVLDNNHGMVFLFENPQPLTFWMANTPLPLDIMFVDQDSVIIRIHKNTQPYSNSQYGSEGKNAMYVVETNAGYATTHDIKEGDRIRF